MIDSDEAAQLERIDQTTCNAVGLESNSENDKKRKRDAADPSTPGKKKFRLSVCTPQFMIASTPKFKVDYVDEIDFNEKPKVMRPKLTRMKSGPVQDITVMQTKRLLYTPRKLAEKIREGLIPKTTIPISPALHCDKRIRARAMEKRNTRDRINNARRHGHTHIGKYHFAMGCKSIRPLTETMEFTFATDSRLRHHHDEHTTIHDKTAIEQEQPKPWQPAITQPKPFVLHTSNRVKQTGPVEISPYKSLSERLKEFDTTFKVHEVLDRPLEITHPEPFRLQTSTRYRPVQTLSTEEQTKIMMEKIPKFKARPLPKKILETHGDLGVPKIDKKPPTAVEGFNLRLLQRLGSRKRKRTEQEQEYADHKRERKRMFKARCVNARILSGESILPPIEHKLPTVPESPMLTTKKRGEVHQMQFESQLLAQREREEEAKKFKARPMPSGSAFKLVPTFLPLTGPIPFSLATENRGAQYEAELRNRLAEEARLDQERRRFKAQPIKIYEDPTTHNTAHSERTLTNPEPFNLLTEIRGVQQQQFSELQQNLCDKDVKTFKANPMPILDRPFIPAKCNKPLTEVLDIPLHSDKRATARVEFDERMKMKMAEIEQMQRQRAEEMKKREEMEREQARREIENHLKAKPMPAFYETYSKEHISLTQKRLQKKIKEQSNRLTVPKTPKFATNKRMGKPGALLNLR